VTLYLAGQGLILASPSSQGAADRGSVSSAARRLKSYLYIV